MSDFKDFKICTKCGNLTASYNKVCTICENTEFKNIEDDDEICQNKKGRCL
jgi:hypothetical protein